MFSVGWQATAFAFITLFLPEPLLPAGIIVSLTGISIAIASVMKGRSAWTAFSILEMWLIFLALLVSRTLTNTIEQYLPITLLQSIMIFLALEVSTVCCDFRQQLSSVISVADTSPGLEGCPNGSAQAAFRAISRAGLFFASCYVLSLAILYVSTSVALAAPLITDISLYIVVVSVSLALLLLSRED